MTEKRIGTGLAGPGRPKGSVTKATLQMREWIEKTGKTPLEYLVSVYRNKKAAREDRIKAATAALPYVHSRMPQDVNVNGNMKVAGKIQTYRFPDNGRDNKT